MLNLKIHNFIIFDFLPIVVVVVVVVVVYRVM